MVRRVAVACCLTLSMLGAGTAVSGSSVSGRAQADGQAIHPQDAGDFNADGFPDLAVGAPEEDVGTVSASGAIHVLYSASRGIQVRGNRYFTQDTTGVGVSERGDFFGRGLAIGDFDADGFDDLAVAAIRKKIGLANHAGAVYVLYGSTRGLTPEGAQFWTQDSPGVPDDPGVGDIFGGGMHGADWNNDGFDDLAIGAWGDTVGGQRFAGSMTILFGSAAGITADGAEFWTQDTAGIEDQAEEGDEFGRHIADGDYNNDGFPDLVVGSRLEEVNGQAEAGAAHVLYGTATGISADGSQFFTQDTAGMPGDGAEAGDWFGRPVWTGNFDGDGFDDLLIGSRFEAVGAAVGAGGFHVLHGSPTGISVDRAQWWTQAGLEGEGVEADDQFGHQAGIGDFNGDGFDDAAVGPFYEDVGAISDAGAINVLYGSASGLTTAGNQYLTQDTAGVPEDAETFDLFGFYLWSKDFDQDGYDDLAASAPFETIGDAPAAGAMFFFRGSAAGLTVQGVKLISQDTPGIRGEGAEDHDLLGGIAA